MGIKSKVKSIVYLLRTKEKIPILQPSASEKLLEGKTALISGGSGGFGKAITEEFLKLGCFVIVSGTNKEKLKAICRQHNNENIRFLVINMKEISTFASKVKEAYSYSPKGSIDILVNCAGVNNAELFLNVQEESYDEVMDINVKGTYFLCQAVAKHMVENAIHGHILNLSSSSSLRPASQPYAISKWAITGMTKGLADVLINYGIIVNAIAPGPTATPMLGKKLGEDINHPTSPIGRYALPEEIAHLAAFMVSGLGDLIVGDTFYMTGGSGTISLHR